MDCRITSAAFDTPGVLSILLDDKRNQNEIKILPSRYIKEMSMTTEERTKQLKKPTRKVKVLSEDNLKSFKVIPDVVIFQNFAIGSKYSTNVLLQNAVEVSVPLQIVSGNSQYFTISHCSQTVCTKIAPGMSYQLKINFIPDELKDYKHEVTLKTENERFVLTILAIGPRPLLNIPDEIFLPVTLVKTVSEKKIWFQNIGKSCARFSVLVNDPFDVSPKKATLAPSETMLFTLYFKPTHCGTSTREMIIKYESGERLCVKLESTASEACVYLEQTKLRFNDTFEGLSDQKSIKLYNNSDYIVQFYWKLHPSGAVEREHIEKLKRKWEEMKAYESLRGNQLETFSIIDYEGHAKVYDRIYRDEVEEFELGDQYLYKNKTFQIEATSGEIYPHSNMLVTVFFSPQACEPYHSCAYLEIIGKEDRIRLDLFGNGLAPLVCFNVDFLNVDEIFVNQVHRYEIVACNKGPIPAKVSFLEPQKKLRQINCIPSQQTLMPDECRAFVVEFSSNREGGFVEEINFSVSDSPEQTTIIMTNTLDSFRDFQIFSGQVICPLLSFDQSEVDFGCVALGFSASKQVHLINTSTVPIYYEIDIPRDGEHPAIKCEELAKIQDRVFSFVHIKEFECCPQKGTVEAEQTVTLNVILTPNVIRSHTVKLVVTMWKNYKIDIKLKYTAQVPVLEVSPPEIPIRFSFVSYPYNRTITIRNKTDLPGYFFIIRDFQQVNDLHPIQFHTKTSEGFINPYEKIEIPLTITVTSLGEHELFFYFLLFGDQPSCPCLIKCNGQGPVVNIRPTLMDFGHITLLKEEKRVFSLLNESPIPAKLAVYGSENSVFVINPTSLELEPLARATIETSLYLCNPGKHTDSLICKIENADDVLLKLSAFGVGTSISSDPVLKEELDLGILLTRRIFRYSVKFTNKGFRSHRIKWSNRKCSKVIRGTEETTEKQPVFVVEPDSYEIPLNNSVVVNFDAYHYEAGKQDENFYCHAMIQGQKERTIIMSTHVTAMFVDPTVELSKKILQFRVDIGPNNVVNSILQDVITIVNVTGVAIIFNAELKSPFFIVHKNSLNSCVTYYLEIDEKIDICVQFVPDLSSTEKECRTDLGVLKLLYHNHPKQDSVKLVGEINYPNVEINPANVQLSCISNYASDYREIILKNVSTLPVRYHWEWHEAQFEEVPIDTTSVKILRSYNNLDKLESSDSEISFLEQPVLRRICVEKEIQSDSQPEALGILKTEVYDRAYTEEYNYKEYLQIQYYIPWTQNLKISEPTRNRERFKAMRNFLLPIISTSRETTTPRSIHTISSLQTIQKLKHHIDSVLDIAPHEGFLAPRECQLISISFHPHPDTTVKANAICSVLGGVKRTVSIQGEASDLSYQLDTDYVEFGRQLFCEICERKLTLANTGNGVLEFFTSCSHSEDGQACEILLETRWFCVQPKHGILAPGKSIDFTIRYFPRITGEFNITFLMEIGYFPPIKVTVHGYATLNQIYLALPRPSLYNCSSFLEYSAIALLSPDYLRSTISCKKLHVHTTQYDEIPKFIRRKLEKDGWVVVLYSELFPTRMDLELALERSLVYEYLLHNAARVKMHISNRKILNIPGLIVPNYLVDFESVILGNRVDYTVSLCNYGPNAALIRLIETPKKDKSQNKGFTFQLTKKYLQMGETTEIFINFWPTVEVYSTEVPQEVYEDIVLEVQHGAKIPIHIKAFVCTPRISYDKSIIDFGEVKCCDCLRRSILLTNDGPVGTMFKATLMSKNPKRMRYTGPFSLRISKDFVEKGMQYLLEVNFQPTVHGLVEAKLILEVEQNPHQLLILLKGSGLYPTMKIHENPVDFGAILPYQIECEKQFSIENTSSLAIEVYFSDFDYDVDREETILRLLGIYYTTNQFLLPPRTAGAGLPRSFIDFYHHLLEQVGQKLLEEEIERHTALGHSSTDVSKHVPSLGSRSTSTKGVSILDIERTKNALFDKTRTELEELLKEQLQSIMNGDAPALNFDPLQAAFEEVEQSTEKKPDDVRESLFLLFHGPPNTRFPYVSNEISKKLLLPVYSIDRLFFEGLLSNPSPTSEQICDIINEKFLKIASECDLLSAPDEDAMDNLEKKINLIMSGKEKKLQVKSKKTGSTKSSKKSSASEKTSSRGSTKKEKGRKEPDVFMDLPIDLITEVLKEKLKEFRVGVIIESLNSIILRKPVIALNVILNSIGNARYIHFVLFSYTYSDYCAYKEYRKQIEEKKRIEEVKKILEKIQEMGADEYVKLSPEILDVYREYVLKERKAASEARKEALGKKLLEGQSEKKLEPSTNTLSTPVTKKVKLDRKSSTAKTESGKSSKATKSKDKKSSEKKSKSSKASKASSASSKKGKRKVKLSPEEEMMRNSILAFEDLTSTILHTMEYWDKRNCLLTKPFSTATQVKSKKDKKETPKKGDKKSPQRNLATPEAGTGSQIFATDSEIGIPCWLVRSPDPEKEFEKLIVYYLETETALLESLSNIQDSLKENLFESSKLYSILTVPPPRNEKNVSKFFIISDVNENQGAIVPDRISEELQNLIKVDDVSLSRDFSSKMTIQSKTKRTKKFKKQSSVRLSDRTSIASSAGKLDSNESATSEQLAPRRILQPGEKWDYRVVFHSSCIGDYNYSFVIEIANAKAVYNVECIGKCDIPKLNTNPEVIYPKIIAMRNERNAHKSCVYVKNSNIFDFGYIFLQKLDEKNSVQPLGTELRLKNHSALPCGISVSLRDPQSKIFLFQPENLTVEPNSVETLNLFALPDKRAKFEDQLLLSIANNPKIEVIKLSCTGCHVNFMIRPKLINIDHALINQTNRQEIVLENISEISVYWRIVEAEKIPKSIKFSSVSGNLAPACKQKLNLEYTPVSSTGIPKMIVMIHVFQLFYDDVKSTTPIYKDFLTISAEVCTVDITYTTEISLDEVKGKVLTAKNFSLLNNGQHDVQFQIGDIKMSDDRNYRKNESIRKMFTVNPMEGVLLPATEFIATIEFLCKKPINFNKVPIFRCIFSYPEYAMTIESFTVTASAKVHMPKYELYPPDEMHFGYQLIGTEKCQEIIVKNTGTFDFQYVMRSLKEIVGQKGKGEKKKGKSVKTLTESKSMSKLSSSKSSSKLTTSKKSDKDKKSDKEKKSDNKSSKTSKVSSKTSAGKPNKKKKAVSPREVFRPTTLTAGPFKVISSTGKVEPGKTQRIKVYCTPKELKEHKETILFFLKDGNVQEKKGKSIILTSIGAVPNINLDDLRYVFQEIYVVDFYDSTNEVKQNGPHCVFIIDEASLFFENVVLNTTHRIHLHIRNIGQIPAEIHAHIQDDQGVFVVEQETINIEPFSTATICLLYKPTSIEVFQSSLVVSYICPENFTGKVLECKLFGKGHLPEIEIQKPAIKDSTEITFNATQIGNCACKDVVFKNVGKIASRVLLEIADDDHDVFSLIPKPDTMKMIKLWTTEATSAMRHTNSVNLKPDEVASFELQFVPKFDMLFNCTLKLHIVNNPFESVFFSVIGHAYDEVIIIDGLPAKIISANSPVSLTIPRVAYDLDFKLCPVNDLRKKCFRIINHSKDQVYRFQFSTTSLNCAINFIPAVGHLKPYFYKDIICTVLPNTPLNLNNEKIELMLCKVTYVDSEQKMLSWDERQNLIVWESNCEVQMTDEEVACSPSESGSLQTNLSPCPQDDSSVKFKTNRASGEPEIFAEADSNSLIPIMFSITADYCSYNCSINELNFPDTFAMQQNSQYFEVTNTSQVNLEIEWKMWMMESFPRRINASEFSKQKEPVVEDFDMNIDTTSIKSLELNTDEDAKNGSAKELFSDSGNQSNRSNDTWCEMDTLPFVISPEIITISPHQTQKFYVTFKPQDVFQFSVQLEGKIPNLKPDLPNIKVSINARSILPLYHFDLEKLNVDEIREGRRFCKEEIDENTQVILFETIGLATLDVKKFLIFNPTAEHLSYEWIPMQQTISKNTICFNCLNFSGIIPSGKTTEAQFTFIPRSFGTFETLYYFKVPKHELTTSFLLHGVARKPKIYFEKPHVHLKPAVLGVEIVDEIEIKNDDYVPCKFKILKESLTVGKDHVLVVEPMAGELQPQSNRSIRIVFRPKKMGEVTFRVKCSVQYMDEHISFGVTGQCLKVDSVVSYENFDGRQVFLSSKTVNEIQLKPMVPYQKEQISFTIANAGQTGFYFMWFVNSKLYSDRVKFNFKDQEGYVSANTDIRSTVAITPLKNTVLKHVKIKLKIPYGPTYTLRLSGVASNSQFHFSFESYDFGQCLVQKNETQYYSTILKFKNTDVAPIILEHNVKKINCVTVNFKSNIIQPKQTEEIPIYFHPLETIQYHNFIPFFVNSKIFTVSIHGEGVPLLLNLVNPADRFIDLGTTTAGKSIVKSVKVINNSTVAINAKFDIWNRLPYYSKKVKTLQPEFDLQQHPAIIYKEKTTEDGKSKKKGKAVKEKKPKKEKVVKPKSGSRKSKKSETASSNNSGVSKKGKKGNKTKSTVEKAQSEAPVETPEEKESRLIQESLSILPKTFVKIHPKHMFEFQIRYNPTEPMKSFTEKIAFQVQDTSETICIVKATCFGMNYYLDRSYVDFGGTVFGLIVKQNVILYNSGDIGGRFKWVIEKSSVFKITPTEGKTNPHSETIFTVTFHATQLYQFYKAETKCVIDNYDKPLYLQVTGCSVKPPSPKQVLKFECPVRDIQTNGVEITNTSYLEWNLRPLISGQYFSVPSVFTVKPNSSNLLQVTYRPLCMTRGVPHEGTLSLNLPDSTTLNYKLFGIAKQPPAVDKFFREISCKTYYSEKLPVQNWLNSAQEFCITTEKLDPHNKMLYKLPGSTIIDVPPNSVREYNWSIYVLKEGILDLRVIFYNVRTKEYLFYEIRLDVKKCDPLKTIELNTCVRNPLSYNLILENPIRTPVTYNITANCSMLSFQQKVAVPPLTEHELEIVYNPLIEGSTEATLEAVSEDLGTYLYTFVLTALTPVPEAPIYFTASLGEIISQKLTLKNDSNEKSEFTMKYDHYAFYSLKSVMLAPNENRNLDIYFEPDDIGKNQSYLSINSTGQGQYIYPLIGTCSLPKPQGPFGVRTGVYKKINFKNPFNKTKTFSVYIRPECFYTPTYALEIESKRQARILVGIEPISAEESARGVGYPRTGKMIVKCEDDSGEIINWAFYLEEECVTAPTSSSEKSSKLSVLTSKSARSSRSAKSSTSSKSAKSSSQS